MQTFVIKVVSKSAPIIFCIIAERLLRNNHHNTIHPGEVSDWLVVRVPWIKDTIHCDWVRGGNWIMGSDSGKWEENYDCAIGLFVVLLVWGPIRVKQNGIAEVESDLSCT